MKNKGWLSIEKIIQDEKNHFTIIQSTFQTSITILLFGKLVFLVITRIVFRLENWLFLEEYKKLFLWVEKLFGRDLFV